MGIDIDVHDLNFDPAYKLQVPGGGLLWDEYEIASTVIDADVWINVPVAKTHGSKVTCCLKNHFGIFPGTTYGWNKARGTDTHGPIPRWPRTLDETWVDLVLVSRVDLNVVDMIQGTEGGAFGGEPKRSNLIVAGVDPIATDLVVAQLMGFNPDDFEFADLGVQRGLGPGRIENVDVRGADPFALQSRFIKAGIDNDGDWGEHSQYGMGPRRWTLLGPLQKDHQFTPAQLTDLSPVPGQANWSDVIWFGFDKIDLDTHFDDPVNKVVYAFTHFTMARSDSVRFWIGSDEGLTIWIDGEQLYQHEGRRRHLLGMDQIRGAVEAGEHRLLIRAEQGRGRFDFSFNICEPIDDIRYSGNRYPGVRYHQAGSHSPLGDLQVQAKQSWDPWRLGGVESSLLGEYDPVVAYHEAPDSVQLKATAAATHALFEVLATQFPDIRVGAVTDTITSSALSRMPFWMAHMGFGKEWWPPEQGIDLKRVLPWSGLSYWLSTASGQVESAKAIAGWLAQGRIPLTGHDEGWEQIAGYVKDKQGARIYSVRPDTSEWHEFGNGTWGRLPGRDWLEMPVLVVEPTTAPLGYDAWIDSAAMVALEFARRERIEYEQDWGARGCPAGVAAWDALVTDWERLPWTTNWARSEPTRDMLGDMGRGYYEMLSRERGLAAQLFATAAARADGERRTALQAAAEGYSETSQTLLTIHEGLPKSRFGDTPAADSLLQEEIGVLQPLMRQARDTERQSLSVLASLLGAEPLPPAQEDPLLRRADGRVLFTWKAGLSKGVYDLTLSGDQLTTRTLRGRETDDEVTHVQHKTRQERGWMLALELHSGTGLYHIDQQPTADNDWVAIIRVDDEWAERDNATDLSVWELPAP